MENVSINPGFVTLEENYKRIREKIKDYANWSISTVWGIGYKFEVKN